MAEISLNHITKIEGHARLDLEIKGGKLIDPTIGPVPEMDILAIDQELCTIFIQVNIKFHQHPGVEFIVKGHIINADAAVSAIEKYFEAPRAVSSCKILQYIPVSIVS